MTRSDVCGALGLDPTRLDRLSCRLASQPPPAMSTPFPLPRSPYPPGPLVTPEISQKAQTSPQPSTPMGTTQTILQQHGLAASKPATISAFNPNALAPPVELSRCVHSLCLPCEMPSC
jgi:hypothetical protein